MTQAEQTSAAGEPAILRITKEAIEARIRGVTYTRMLDDFSQPSTTTICAIFMVNGFSVRGESACLDPRAFNEQMGQKIAYENAFDKLWQLEGYLAADRAHGLVEKTARAAHEVNRAYCSAIGDFSQPAWEDAPEWQRDSAIAGVKAHLAGDMTPEQAHASWLAMKLADGWKYGPVKNPETKEHPCCVPYDELPQEQRVKDYLFGAVVKASA